MKIGFVAGGVLCLAVAAGTAATGRLDDARQPPASQPRFVNARVAARQVEADLARAFRAEVAARPGPGWIGYSVPAVPGDRRTCEGDGPSRVYLEGRPAGRSWGDPARAALEGTQQIAILFRVEAARTARLRVVSTECEVDAGGLPVVWLSGVRPADSVALLLGMVRGGGDDRDLQGGIRDEAAIMAIALHADPSAERALEGLVSPDRPFAVRKRAAFWLGAARGEEGFAVLKRLAAAEPDAAFRRELVFPLSLSREAASTDVLIGLARADGDSGVRKQAMFWLGQKAGQAVASTLTTAAASDPDTEVKKQAVFGLSRMPNGEGIPRLIEVARSNPNPEVRKRALFWLGHSDDPRALGYLEEFLKK